MSTLLQVSDPHFGTERAEVVEALVAFAREQAPEIAVVSGDITQRARRAQFRAAREFIDRLGIAATIAIPGNHDIPLFDLVARVFAPYANYRREFGDELEPAFESSHCLVLALNTTRARRRKDGEVSAAQIERVAERLHRARQGQLRVVVVHHPPAVTLEADRVNLLRGHDNAVRRWAAAGADLVLGGHIHLPYVLPLHKSHAGLARKVWAVQAGTAVSKRVRHEAGNSINLIRCLAHGTQRCAVVERWDYAEARRRFELHSAQQLECDAG